MIRPDLAWFRDGFVTRPLHWMCDGIGVRHAKQAPIVLLVHLHPGARRSAHLLGCDPVRARVESNAYLVTLMTRDRHRAGAVRAKTLAVACGFVLFATTSFRVLAVATGWCLGFAVVPWLVLYSAFANI
jgi:hypothetical protein